MNMAYKHPDIPQEQITYCQPCAELLNAEPCDECGGWSVKDCENCGTPSLYDENPTPIIPHSYDIVKR